MEAATKELPVLRVIKERDDLPDWTEYLKREKDQPAIIDLDLVICKVFGIKPENMFTRSRKRELKDARYAYFYIMHRVFKYTQKAVQRITGWDHASVFQGCQKIDWFMEAEPAFAFKMNRVMDIIENGVVRIPVDPEVQEHAYKLVFRGGEFIQAMKIKGQ